MNDRKLEIELTRQILTVLDGDRVVQTFPVSTSRFGPGERFGSLCTPRGTHAIRAKVGEDQPEGAVFVGRRFTDEIYNDELAREHPGRDWILTRLVWLTGREPGRNRGGTVDTLRRYIYIHGTPDTEPMGVPASHGCIRMRNRDMIDLFNLVEPGNIVEIVP
jgi:L,D-transpeptidase YbiS